MKFKSKLIISALLGLFMGFILPHIVFYTFFTTSALSILVWGAVGIIICFFAKNLKQSIFLAQAYLVFVVESFLFLGQLKFDSEFFKVILFLFIMMIVALICGAIMGIFSFYFWRLVRKLLHLT